MAGLAVADVLASYTDPGRSLKLKWPNDVLLDGAKLAGILIDTEAAADGSVEWMVIGIGANLAFAPDLPGRPTVCLASSGPAPPTEEVAALVLASLAGRRAALLTMGFEPIRLAWLARAHPLGTPLLVTLPGGQLEGAFAGLAPSGALLLETKQGRQTIAAGEVQPVRQQ
jgi:BirA family biotin operon repressor/biotin-[acetyl-CoA-carboxylase] ligase